MAHHSLASRRTALQWLQHVKKCRVPAASTESTDSRSHGTVRVWHTAFTANGYKVFTANGYNPVLYKAIEDVDSATESIWVTMFALSSICCTQKLIDKRKKFPDMEIKVIIDLKWARENKSSAAAVRQLIENGIDVYQPRKTSKRNHRKLLICDGVFATAGMMNYTKVGQEDNDEDLLYMFGQPGTFARLDL